MNTQNSHAQFECVCTLSHSHSQSSTQCFVRGAAAYAAGAGVALMSPLCEEDKERRGMNYGSCNALVGEGKPYAITRDHLAGLVVMVGTMMYFDADWKQIAAAAVGATGGSVAAQYGYEAYNK